MKLKSVKLTLILDKEDGGIIEALSPLTATQRNLVIEKALLYYARYLEENTHIVEPLFDAEKVNSNEVFEPLKREFIKLSPEKDTESRRKRLDALLGDKKEESKVDSKQEVGNRKLYRIEVLNEKAGRMIEYAASVDRTTMDLVKRALEYYIRLVQGDESIKDFNLLHIESKRVDLVGVECGSSDIPESESVKSSMYVYILDGLLRSIMIDMKPKDRKKVFRDAVRYYSEYIEANPEVEGYLYDINKINSDEEIDVNKINSDEEKYQKANRVGIRYDIVDEKQQRIMAYVCSKTAYPSLFIEKALVYYIDKILKCKPTEIGEKLQLEMRVRS